MSSARSVGARSAVWTRIRWAVFVLGVVMLVLVVRRAGPSTVVAILRSSAPWIPLLLVLEGSWMAMDILVLRTLLGPRAEEVPAGAYARSAITAYAVTVLAPAGRASGEVARAVVLAPYVGSARVTAAAIGVQGSSLLGTSLISVVCFAAAARWIGLTAHLTLLVGANVLVTGVAGAALLWGARSPRVWRGLQKLVKSLPDWSSEPDDRGPRARAVGWSFVGRSIETVLYVAVVRAAAGMASPSRALMAQSVSLVTALFGDLVPQRAGLTESAYWFFSSDIGLASPATAVSIALLLRANQLLLAAGCLLLGLAWKGRAAEPIRNGSP